MSVLSKITREFEHFQQSTLRLCIDRFDPFSRQLFYLAALYNASVPYSRPVGLGHEKLTHLGY
jgi:hypothetical protein